MNKRLTAVLLASTCVFGANSQNFDSPDNISKNNLLSTPIIALKNADDVNNTFLLVMDQSYTSGSTILPNLAFDDSDDMPLMAPSPSFTESHDEDEEVEEDKVKLVRPSRRLPGKTKVFFDPGLVQFSDLQSIPMVVSDCESSDEETN